MNETGGAVERPPSNSTAAVQAPVEADAYMNPTYRKCRWRKLLSDQQTPILPKSLLTEKNSLTRDLS